MKRWIVTAVLALALTSLTPAVTWADISEGSAQTVREGDIVVGDGVTATFDEETGAVVFYSDGGTLWRDWVEKSGLEWDAIKSIKVGETSGKIYLPEDSSEIFAVSAETMDLRGFDTSNVTTMEKMFWGCIQLREVNLSEFDTSNVTNMFCMFCPCENLQTLDLSSFDTSNVTDMRNMFSGCSCRSVDLSSFDTSNVERMDYMFWDSSLYSGNFEDQVFDLSNFDMSNVTSAKDMLEGHGRKIKIPRNVSCDVHVGLMFDKEGNAYEYLPNVSESITLMDFRDVQDPEKWYHKPVYWAFEKGITSGYGSYTFQPEAPLTRAQAVNFLYKFAGKPDVSGLEGQDFTDIAEDAWYHDAVKWAAANGITKGYGEGTFQPDTPCTRAMIVSFLTHYAKLTGSYVEPAATSSFTDVADNAWYKASVDWAVANNITSGYGQGTFRPNVICNRAMMVTFLKSLSELSDVGLEECG